MTGGLMMDAKSHLKRMFLISMFRNLIPKFHADEGACLKALLKNVHTMSQKCNLELYTRFRDINSNYH